MYRYIETPYGDIIKKPLFTINPMEFIPVTKEVLNSLEIGKEYLFCCSKNKDGLYGTTYKHEDGNTYVKFGNTPVYDDWKIKL